MKISFLEKIGSKFGSALFEKNPLMYEGKIDIVNPGRGWYRIYTFALGREDLEALKWLPFEENETLALVLIDIGAYANKIIDDNALAYFEKILTRFKEKEKDIILRIAYDTEGKGMQKEPSLLSQVTLHMHQLGSIVQKYSDNIYISQGLFAGSWGEMHTSKFLSPDRPDKIKILADTWENETNSAVRMAFRRPVQVRKAYEEKNFRYDTGIFDDAILASDTHLGTFGEFEDESSWQKPWCRSKEMKFIRHLSENVPIGGEAVAGSHMASPEETIETLKSMNISYLNCVHDAKIIDYWKNCKFENDGKSSSYFSDLYSYISAHLGYRIHVSGAELLNKKRGLKITFTNTGFSNMYEEADLFLYIITADEDTFRIDIPFDMRTIRGGETKEIVVEDLSRVQGGSKLFVRMERKKDKKVIHFANPEAGERVFIGKMI